MRIAIRLFPLLLAVSFSVARGLAGPATAPQTNQNVRVIEVTAKKYEFNPSPIHVKQGTKVQLKITSLDRKHGFKISVYPDGSDAKGDPGLIFATNEECFEIDKGAPAVIEFVAHTPGTYSFKCCKHCGPGHKGMKGQLIVEP